MNPARGLTSAVVVALVVVCSPTAETQAPPDVIRVRLSRNDNHVAGVGVGLTFDKDRVAKAMAATPLTLPDPLPAGALVGFNSADNVFVLVSRAASGDGAVLVVDANVNRDLRDDAAVQVPRRTKPGDGAIVRIKRTYPGPPPVDVWLPYRFAYTPTADRSGVERPAFFVTAAYRMEGVIHFRGSEYVAELHDFNQRGTFDRSNLSRGTVLRVYPKGAPDEERTWLHGYELISLGDEFYEVADGALDGSWLELKRNTLAHASIGRSVPEFRMTDTESATFALSDYRGRYLLLDFWPSWCGPCIAQFPNIKKTVDRYSERQLAVVGINLDNQDALPTARKIVADKGLTWRHVMEGRGYFLPIYQILGRLPERRMAFPLYVAIAPDGVVRYASNDFGKMQLFLEDALAVDAARRNTLFIPMAPADRSRAAAPRAVDFTSAALQSLLARPGVKLPADLPNEARVGRLPNDTLVVVRAAADPGRAFLRVDTNRDFDLTTEDEKEIPILNDAPPKLEETPSFEFSVTYASGGMAFRPFRFFGRRLTPGGTPAIFYVGWEARSSGTFVIDDVEYELSIVDPTADLWWTADDLRSEGALTLREKRGGKWTVVDASSTRIPLAGRLFRVAHVHDDGQMVKLEPISSP